MPRITDEDKVLIGELGLQRIKGMEEARRLEKAAIDMRNSIRNISYRAIAKKFNTDTSVVAKYAYKALEEERAKERKSVLQSDSMKVE